MTALLALVRRELAERRMVLAAGLLVGLLPLAAPLLPLDSGQPPDEVRGAAAVALFWLASLVGALALGATVFGSDLAERRLGFYFSRPVSGGSVLAGKLGAALALALATPVLVVLPAALLDRRLPELFYLWDLGRRATDRVVPPAEALVVWGALVLVLMLLAHYLRTVALARSPWRLLDLAGLVVGFLAVRWIASRLLEGWAPVALFWALGAVAIVLPVALVAGVAAQVLWGRTSVRRGYRLLVVTFWGLTAAALAAASGWTSWVLAAGPEELDQLSSVRVAPTGDWVVVSGRARSGADYQPSFLYRVADGTHLRLPAGDPGFLEFMGRPAAVFAADGSVACWFESVTGLGALLRGARPLVQSPELACADLGRRPVRPRATSVVLPPDPGSHFKRLIALSPDGRLFAYVADRFLMVEDVARRRIVISRRLPTAIPYGELFFAPSGERLYLLGRACRPRCRLDLWRIELAGGGFEAVLGLEGGWAWSRDPVGQRLLLMEPVDGRLFVAELASGALRPLAPPTAARAWVGQFLADGRLLLGAPGDGLGRLFFAGLDEDLSWVGLGELWLAGRDGAPLRRLPLRDGALRPGGQPAPDRLLLAYTAPERRQSSWRRVLEPRHYTTYLIDLASGEERLVGADLMPVAGPETGPVSVGSRLLVRGGRELQLLDPETLARRVVLSGGEPGRGAG